MQARKYGIWIVTVFCLYGYGLPAFGSDANDLSELLEPIRVQYGLPAMAGAVIVDGQIAAVGATGVRKYGDATPVTAGDSFHLGSCTKAMTATLIGMLIEEGKLDWQTTLGEVFSEMDMRPEYRDVTVEHLLAHRAGLPPSEQSWPKGKTFTDMYELPGCPMQQRLEYTRLMLRQEPVARPGEAYVYSNAGYAVLGAMAEQVTGTPWETLMQTKLFKPLEMTSAGFGAMGSAATLNQPWQHRTVLNRPYPVEPGPRADNPPVIGPGGTVHCSMRDWAKFVILHLQAEDGDTDLLKQQTCRKLHTPAFDGDYAGGWQVTERSWGDGRVLTHAGTNTMNYAVVWMAPRRAFAVLVATNQGGDETAKACDDAASRLIRHFLQNTQ